MMVPDWLVRSAQRIQAMWALKAVPEVKEKIKLGTLSITTVAQIQTFIRHEQKQGIQRTPDQKLELFSHFENKTSKEVKSEILELHGKPELTKLNLELDLETQAMWMEVRERSAHLTQGDPLQCFRLLLKDWLSQQNKCARSKVIINTTQACPTQNTHQNTVQTVNDKTIRQSGPLSTQVQRNISWSTKQARSRYITLATKSEVLQRDQNKCRNCNLHRGVKEFGMGAMRRQ